MYILDLYYHSAVSSNGVLSLLSITYFFRVFPVLCILGLESEL